MGRKESLIRAEGESALDFLLRQFESGTLGKQPVISSGSVFPIGCALFAASAFVACGFSFAAPIIVLPLLIAGIVGAFWVSRLAANDLKKRAIRDLAGYDDVRVVPPMLDVLGWPQAEMQWVANLTLLRLLPRLSETDSHLLRSKHRQALRDMLSNYMLSTNPDDAIAIAVLTVLERIGTKADLISVTAVARKPADTVQEQQVKQKAVALIPILKARESGPPDTLLRPSEPPGHESLLRPSGDSPSDPSSLLRPADEEPGEH
jgi:hypothetical protein